MKTNSNICGRLILTLAVISSQSVGSIWATEITNAIPLIHIHADQSVAPVSPVFCGMMTEEINHSYDGGLYAELIQNRAFKDNSETPTHWSAIQNGGAIASIALDKTNALTDQLVPCLRLDVAKASKSDLAGVANDGFWGIPVKPSTTYHSSFYAKAGPGFSGSITVCIQSRDGTRNFAQAKVKHLGDGWQRYSVTLVTPHNLVSTSDARFVLAADSSGTIWFNLVSVFPPTWKNRPNGNRLDLMQTLDNMKPKFLRFPGGNYLEGSTIATRFPWKQTLGDLSQRPGHLGCWGYRSTDGLGLLEFLEWAEDLKAEPVLAVYAGYSLPPKNEVIQAGHDLEAYVADALDEIEYVMGDKTTKWGARRAADGHAAPFKLHYVEIGNEDWFDPSDSYDARFTQFYDAIKAKYPQLRCISTVGNEQPEKKRVHSRTPDLLDEHYYWAAADFEKQAPNRFDKYDRKGPKIFVGEWAAYEDIVPWDAKSKQLPPTPNFKAALGDAAWLTAMERNSGIILMQCYAPMLVNVNPGGRQWRPNLIGYDSLNAYGSPSYYVLQMFNANCGDAVVKTELEMATLDRRLPLNYSVTRDTAHGFIFIKLVNAADRPQPVQIDLDGVRKIKPSGTSIVLKSDQLDDGNSIGDPTKIVPVSEKIFAPSNSFTRTLVPYSVTVLRIRANITPAVKSADQASLLEYQRERKTAELNLEHLKNPVWISNDNLRDPSVIKTKGGYHLFYSRFSSPTSGWGDPENWHIAEVFTKDFATFTNDRDVSPAGCASPGDVVKWHGRWLLPYQTYPGKPTQLVLAESTNLETWTQPRPFLAEALDLPWNQLHRVIDPSFVVDGNTLHCFFIGSANHTNAAGKIIRANLMGHAITRDPNLKQWEILTPNAPLIGYSDEAPDGVENTMIFRTGDHWTMIYSEGLEAQHLACATSSDLVQWKLQGPIEIQRQYWTARKYGAPYVWREENQWLMILMGTSKTDRTTFGLLTSLDGTRWQLLPGKKHSN